MAIVAHTTTAIANFLLSRGIFSTRELKNGVFRFNKPTRESPTVDAAIDPTAESDKAESDKLTIDCSIGYFLQEIKLFLRLNGWEEKSSTLHSLVYTKGDLEFVSQSSLFRTEIEVRKKVK